MNTLEKHNNEVQDNLMKIWDEKKETLGLGEYSDEIALHIENQNNELLKKIAKGEIERLSVNNKDNPKTHICFKLDCITFTSEITGKEICVHQAMVEQHNNAIEDQLTHWQQVLEDLEK